MCLLTTLRYYWPCFEEPSCKSLNKAIVSLTFPSFLHFISGHLNRATFFSVVTAISYGKYRRGLILTGIEVPANYSVVIGQINHGYSDRGYYRWKRSLKVSRSCVSTGIQSHKGPARSSRLETMLLVEMLIATENEATSRLTISVITHIALRAARVSSRTSLTKKPRGDKT